MNASPLTSEDYNKALLEDVIPFWTKHGFDRECGGMITSLDRDGSVLDTDKSIWFQGRAGWIYATLFNAVERRREWLEISRSCISFLRRFAYAPDGKMYFSVTREGRPLRMRRYVFSECFAAIACAAYAKAAGEDRAAADAINAFSAYIRHNFTPGVMPPKVDQETRPMRGLTPYMAGIVTAQELRNTLGDIGVAGRACSEWITLWIGEIERFFMHPEHEAVMEAVAPDGSIIDHFDGRMLNPGHSIEAGWFIMREGWIRGDKAIVRTGLTILDWMWERGWDKEYGGMLYYCDLKGLPIQEYWHDMKFWWPHNEAVIATLMASKLTGDRKYLKWYEKVRDWSFAHFPDREHGEWYGYLHRDGTPSALLKGSIWKGPFHLPRMLLWCMRLLDDGTSGPPTIA